MKKMLIIEDERNLADLIAEFFAEKGWKVEVAYDLETGMKKYTSDFDFVLLDIMLKVGTSFPLLEKIKQENPSKPVYMFSGYDDDEFIEEAERLGADGFIPKTMGLDYLMDFFISKAGESSKDKDQ